jgi:hypothetical protein
MVSGFIEAREQFVEALVTEAQSRPQLYEASVDDDAVKPGPQVRVPFERVQRKKRRQERVLHGVGAVGFDAKNAAGNAGHLRPFWYCAATGEWSVLAQPDGDGDALADLPLGVDLLQRGVSCARTRRPRPLLHRRADRSGGRGRTTSGRG